MAFMLSPEETRVLGCLIEKERTTPEQYPLSLNALLNACNQTTNREPITAYDEQAVSLALDDLRAKKLATQVWGSGSRVQRFRHNLLDHFELNTGEVALLCVLMLRGPQTSGELRARTERLHTFGSIGEVEQALHELGAGAEPLVRMMPPQPGQKERRFVQMLSAEVPVAAAAGDAPLNPAPPSRLETVEAELASLKGEVANLKTELASLREEFAKFRKQFE